MIAKVSKQSILQLNQPVLVVAPVNDAFADVVLGRKGSFALLIALNEPLSRARYSIPTAPPDRG